MREQVTFFCPAHPAESPDFPRSAVVPCVHVTSVVSGRACLGCRSTPRAIGHVRGLLLVLCFRELGLMWVCGPGIDQPHAQCAAAYCHRSSCANIHCNTNIHLTSADQHEPTSACDHTHTRPFQERFSCLYGTHFITYRQEMMHEHERWCCGGVWGLHM